MANNEFYRNFSNRTSFNGIPCGADEELVPAVLTSEMKITLKPLGLNYDYVETWTFQHGKKVPVVFIPNKKGYMDMYMKLFNNDVERYLKHTDSILSEDLSLDEFLDNINDEDGEGFDPTGTTEHEDLAMLMLAISDLIQEVSKKYPEADAVLNLLLDGYQKNEIFKQVDLRRGKTQAYAYIEKIQKYAKELYYKSYR